MGEDDKMFLPEVQNRKYSRLNHCESLANKNKSPYICSRINQKNARL